MIKWLDGTTSSLPRIHIPSKDPEYYEIDVFSFGSHKDPLWCASVTHRFFPYGRDHFRTQEEAYDFVVSVVNLLELKYPNIKCSNFSFLTKE